MVAPMVKYNQLSALKAKSLPAGKHADGQGLWLFKSTPQTGKWKLRFSVSGRVREMGLGRWPDVSLAEAREHAAAARKRVRARADPIEERRQARHRVSAMTIREAVESCFAAKQADLKGDGVAGRWLSPLSTHVLPKIGKDPIESVDQHTLKRVLEPIWQTKTEAARKALNRMNLTLQHAAAHGLEVDLQATMKARALLGKQRHSVEHIPALPYADAPAFYQMLCGEPATSALALRFLMLTLARTSEIRFAQYTDIEADVWIIPAEHTKTEKEHRVPLTAEALRVIKLARKAPEQTLLFPSSHGKVMSDATMSKFMKDRGYTARPHGFRSTFRSWSEEKTDASYEVKETCLGHKVGSEVERAYQRSDLLDKRRMLLTQWTEFLLGR